MVLHRKNGKPYELNDKGEIILSPSQKATLDQLMKEKEERDNAR